MGWQQAAAILIGAAFVLLVLKSMFGQWRQSDNKTPLRGRFSTAKEWLEENGYKILKIRQRSEWVGYYDSREFRKQYIADFVVKKGAKSYAVKLQSARDKGLSGQKVRDMWYPLFTAFQVDGILHLDVDNDKVHLIDFQLKSPGFVRWRTFVNRSLWFLSGMIAALALFHAR
ncbi:hypothetical protein [Alicyclobacillus sp. SO9]|uniref:hypothetical protein n=1 Tax=Alicyclobacillus sp. SO9 TaxID=2665646 RepID=UPI0018E70EF4|nr:hypothetical protein [Alicyclobacillus sp. SO9]QQE76964.1 hypothetical protein GI364_13280 [Alicyclobacillus sp. SO9]